MLHAPVGVEFPAKGEGVQRDILFVSNERRGIKLRLYERQGVAQYWIVDPTAWAIDVWRFEADLPHDRYVDRLPVRLAEEELGEIDLEEIFAAD